MTSDTQRQWLEGVPGDLLRTAIRRVTEPVGDRMSSQALATAGLVISATTTKAKIGSTDFYGIANGQLVTIANGTDMPALVGTITAASYNVFCFFVDAASAVTVAMGTESTTLAGIVFPQFPKNKALVGFLIVTYASTFTGGSTALNTATTVYVSPIGAFDPTVLTG